MEVIVDAPPVVGQGIMTAAEPLGGIRAHCNQSDLKGFVHRVRYFLLI